MPFAGKKASQRLLDVGLALEVLALDELGDVVLVVLLALALGALLQALVALGQFAERCEGVGAELVEDAGDELGELLVLAVAVDGKGVAWDGSVDCGQQPCLVSPGSRLSVSLALFWI